jgi:cytochrome c peroxidase
MKGAFKTPTLRDITRTAPYFHDGSAIDLIAVVEHYNKGGVIKTNLSPNMQALSLSQQEKADLIAFMQALESPYVPVSLPELPRD